MDESSASQLRMLRTEAPDLVRHRLRPLPLPRPVRPSRSSQPRISRLPVRRLPRVERPDRDPALEQTRNGRVIGYTPWMIALPQVAAILTVWALLVAPFHTGTVLSTAPSETASAARPVTFAEPPTIMERARMASSSGLYRPQNTATIATGTIREDDRRRSALAFAISGVLAFAGAGLWRWLPCRNAATDGGQEVGGVVLQGYNKCYTSDGERRPWDTPTKAMFAAGVGLEVVSLLYFISHLREDKARATPSP